MLEGLDTLQQLILFGIIGFIAQLIDGSLGMAYGISATSLLLSFGISPALVSTGVHIAKTVTAAISGLSHWRLGNVDRSLFIKLVLPGVSGAVIGAYLLLNFPVERVRMFVSLYLLIMGVFIIWKAFKPIVARVVATWVIPLGLVGGFLDALSGGGWGPIVTSTLVARGNNPRMTIGSTNSAEFFVALATSVALFHAISIQEIWIPVAGLALGGAIAAPFAAYITRHIPIRPLMILVGLLIIFLSLRTLLISMGVWPWF